MNINLDQKLIDKIIDAIRRIEGKISPLTTEILWNKMRRD